MRYEADWPPMMVATCSCKNCQKQAGSALSILAVLPQSGLRVTGELTTYNDIAKSGNTVYRKFCGSCGSPVITETPEAQAQGMIFIKAGSLDQAEDLKPTVHFWTSTAQHWVVFPEGGKQLDTQ
ncbi:GFA family protein [Novosphingobium sp. Chol11]|uniref:GFA family protein n=1 Tax=Novosphingobium sp. Chol11 TaxID=1385763 RepID=UPI0025D34EF9|nr:GFA family protein [Novosphingobium sp. Chol11]